MFENLKFSSNHVHTDWGSNLRLLDTIVKIEPLLQRALDLKYKGLILTEHESLVSHVRMMSLIKEYKEKGKLPEDFRVGYGNEIYLVDSIEACKKREERYNHFIIIAKDKKGHELLRRLSSKAWSQSYFTGKMRRVPLEKKQLAEIMNKYEGKGHLICSTACIGNQLSEWILGLLKTEDIVLKHKIHNYIKYCKEVFGEENVYLEIQPSSDEEQIAYNKFILKLSKAYNLPVQITNDVHYIKKEHKNIHKAFLQSREGDRETEDFYQTCYMMTLEEMWDLTKDYLSKEEFEEIIANTYNLVSSLEQYDLFKSTVIPEIDVSKQQWELKHIFENWYNKYEYINKYAHSEYIQDRYFLAKLEEGFIEKGFKVEDEKYIDRIDKEIKELYIISEALGERMSSYYNLMQFLIDIMWRVSVCACGRGSSVGFFSCYLLGITAINPFDYDLNCYWRHMHHSKISFADIDTDCSGDKKQQLLSEIKKEIGADNILNILTLKTEKTKSAILTVLRGLGVDSDISGYIASLIEQERGVIFSLSDTWYGNEEKGRKPNKQFIEEIEKLEQELGVDIKEALFMVEGLVSSYSSHPCGVMVYKSGYIEGNNAMMVTPNGTSTTCFTMGDSELVGNIKFDFLFTDAVSKIQSTLELLLKHGEIEWQGSLRKTYDKYLHPDVVKKEISQEMWDKINNGEVLSLFQFGDSLVGRETIKKVKPQNIFELATANSLMRLMSMEDGRMPLDIYLNNRRDKTIALMEMKRYGLTSENIQTIERLLGRTYYIADTQELMMICLGDKEISGFPMKKMDNARKIIGKKLMSKIPQLKEDYYQSGRKLGTNEGLLNYIWDYVIQPQLG